MASFESRIAPTFPTAEDFQRRRWIFVPYDRLTDRVGPIAEQPAVETGIVLIESAAFARRRPYHKKKLVLLLANQRHFALEQAAGGVRVLYHRTEKTHGAALLELQQQHGLGQITVSEPAERELRLELADGVARGLKLHKVADSTWLSTTGDFIRVFGSYKAGRSYVMDRFYRAMRQQTGILMDKGKPVGGQFSFDAENRKPYKGEVPVPIAPAFPPDAITEEVIAEVECLYPDHFGSIAGFNLPTTQADADRAWHFALEHLLPHFGPYEDAMRDDEPHLFHSRLSGVMNLGRLLPAQMVGDVEAAAKAGTIPLASAEGFIRQILGWREFMHHLHQQTDGYRALAATVPQEQRIRAHEPGLFDGAMPSALGASLPLPAVYWGASSGLHCVDTAVRQVLDEGWTHHILRLMVLSNLATLCGFSPRDLTDWFWFGYIDAYDWVVETNVLGMSTYADGGVTATKPYVSGAAYIHRMSNFCGRCKFNPKKSVGDDACPFTALYWTFLERNRDKLGNNFRLQMPYNTLRKKSAAELVQLRARAAQAIEALEATAYPTAT